MHNKASDIAKYAKYDGYKKELVSMFIILLIKNALRLQINLLLVVVLKMEICQTKS